MKEYETSNTIRFDEVETPGGLVVFRKLYVQKKALQLIRNPELVEVVVRRAKGRET